MPLTDTSLDAAAVQLGLYRAMSGEQRLLLASEMSLSVRELNRAGIRRDHPDWTEAGDCPGAPQDCIPASTVTRPFAMSLPQESLVKVIEPVQR